MSRSVPAVLDGLPETTIVRADRPHQGVWAGAPHVTRHGEQFLMSHRLRAPVPQRGWRTVIGRSADGEHFDTILRLDAKDVLTSGPDGTVSLERSHVGFFAGQWHLWTSWLDHTGRVWEIRHMTADEPGGFDIGDATIALARPPATAVGGVKDPVVFEHRGKLLMFFVGWETGAGPGHTYLARSRDGGRTFEPLSDEPALRAHGWAAAEVRVSALTPLSRGQLLLWVDYAETRGENMVEHTALAVATGPLDLPNLGDGEPLRAWSDPLSRRYASAVAVGEDLYVYHEKETPTGSHDLVLVKVRRSDLVAALPGARRKRR
jgi:hypothetical protein